MNATDRGRASRADAGPAGPLVALLTDIEGTTTDPAFVQGVLFPYARAQIPAYIRSHRDDPRTAAVLRDVRAHEADAGLDEEAIVALLCRWIDEDRKITALKTLQGYVWEDGYRSGAFRGHLYEDAAKALHRWHRAGLRLYVFSSGSVAAQKLLFGHSDHGDLTGLFSGFFDTTTGSKRAPGAYAAIAAAIGAAPGAILFLSDTTQELEAAQEAGMTVCGVHRDEPSDMTVAYPRARTFDDVERYVEARRADSSSR